MEQTKHEVSKPILSPTRSLDEGFESDPDRISTDSELTPVTQIPTFNLLHRTDRDGVQHTTITRHNVTETSPLSSIICIDGGVELAESDHNTSGDDSKVEQEQPPKFDQKQHIHHRVKNKAPLPPKSVASNKSNSNNSNPAYQTIQPRSQSVDRIRVNNDFNKNQNILAGRFVRVSVDSKQQYLNYFKNFKSYQHYQTTNGRLLPATGSTSNLYKSYQQQKQSMNKSSSVNSISHYEQQPIISGLLSLSNLSSSIFPMQQTSQFNGYSTVRVSKSYHQHFSSHQQQSHFNASSWTSSMDPRKARK